MVLMSQCLIDAIFQAHFASGGTAAFTEEDLIRRFDQFYAESETIVAGVAASIASNDLAKLSELVDLSQKLTDTHLRNQVTPGGHPGSSAPWVPPATSLLLRVSRWPRGSEYPRRVPIVDMLLNNISRCLNAVL